MPSKNIRKSFTPNSFYHIYNRGVAKQNIFLEDADYAYFMSLLKRHLGKKIVTNERNAHTYPNYRNDINLIAFCLMPNHFHLLVYQNEDENAITKLLRSLCTAYTMYFNKKYKRVGHLFQERYKASLVSNDAYALHISRYIHLNPREYQTYKWSSLPYYTYEYEADWIKPQKIMSMFNDIKSYVEFLQDYEEQKQILDELKYELADQ